MKKLLVAAACLMALGTHAQRRDTSKMYDVSKRIFIEPLALVDVYNASSLHLGLEWPLVRDFCSVFGVWGQYSLQPFETSSNYGSYVKMGLKFYPFTLVTGKKPHKKPVYVSLQFFYKWQRYTVDDNVEDFNNNTSGAPVTYILRKRAEGINFEIGEAIPLRRFCFESYAGLGVRISTVANSISDSLFGQLYDVNEGSVNRIGNSAKTNAVLPSMTLGIRLGYLFKTRPQPSADAAHVRTRRWLSRL